MPDERHDGGPAFPSTHAALPDYRPTTTVDPETFTRYGMSLRDWFAGQALVLVGANSYYQEGLSWAGAAQMAYELADAMLAEREKTS